MSAIESCLTEKEKARFLESAYLAGLWYVNGQNTQENPWGGVRVSADTGRLLYEYWPMTGVCSGAGVWSQALGMCGLFALAKTPFPEGGGVKFGASAELAAGYLCSLQFLDSRFPKAYGGMREATPLAMHKMSYCRDGATGGFGLAALYRETKKAEYLERANLFCDWYRHYGSDAGGWPFCEFDFSTCEAKHYVLGDWQAGGSLAYYYTAMASGDNRWLDEGFRPVMERLLEIGNPDGAEYKPWQWHGDNRMTTGNDDFANVALAGAFRAFQDERYLALLRKRLAWVLPMQDADGSFPNYGSTFVCALELLEFLELVKDYGLPDKTDRTVEALLRAARYGLTLQETALPDRRAYGGIYGQSSFGSIRCRIHSRDTAYALHLFLRLAGFEAPCLSARGWSESGQG